MIQILLSLFRSEECWLNFPRVPLQDFLYQLKGNIDDERKWRLNPLNHQRLFLPLYHCMVDPRLRKKTIYIVINLFSFF